MELLKTLRYVRTMSSEEFQKMSEQITQVGQRTLNELVLRLEEVGIHVKEADADSVAYPLLASINTTPAQPELIHSLQFGEEYAMAFLYGSSIYGTSTEDSDIDYIIVAHENVWPHINEYHPGYEMCDVTLMTPADFEKRLEDHQISALECAFLDTTFNMPIDKVKLRRSISQACELAWVKARKKLDKVSPDYAPHIGRKSAWHALRIADFGLQILEHGRILNYASMNHLYQTLLDCETWADIVHHEQDFYGILRAKRSKIRALVPELKG